MIKLKITAFILFFFCVVPFSVAAGDFDGSKPFICVIIETSACAPDEECERGTAQSINLPQILNFNFKEKTISGVLKSGEMVSTRIENIMHDDGKLLLQGVDDGKAWSMAITEESGNITLTASGDQEGFIAFGVCIPDPVKK